MTRWSQPYSAEFQKSKSPYEATSQKFGSVQILNSDEKLNGIQKIGFALHTPDSPVWAPNKLVIMTSQWSEHSTRRPQQDRASLIASELDIPVLAIDMPGQSPDSDNLTREQKAAIAQGDYSVLGADLWKVAEDALDQSGMALSDYEVTLFGMSQGGTIVAGMAESVDEDVTVSDIVLWNSPSADNIRRRDALTLGGDFITKGGIDHEYYKNLNPHWAYEETNKDMLRIAKKLRGHLLLPVLGMSRANDSRALFLPLKEKLKGSRVTFVHSELDPISADYDNHAAEEYLKRIYKADIRRLGLNEEYHAITNSVGAVAEMAALVIRSTN